MQDALRNYVALATGLSKMSKKKAKVVAKQLAKSSGETVDNLQSFTEGLMTSGNANRDALVKLIRYEVDRALGTIGLATVEEVEQLTVRVHELERDLREARLDTASSTDATSTADTAPAKKTTARRATASKTTATKTAATTAAKATTAKATPRTAATKTVAKKTTAAKPIVAKTTAAKTTASKTTASKTTTPTTRRRSATASSARRTTPETSEE